MTASELLPKVKKAKTITGNFHDDALEIVIEEVLAYLLDAGVKEKNITVGVVVRGVSDLWDVPNGELSDYFIQRAKQLALKGDDDDVQT